MSTTPPATHRTRSVRLTRFSLPDDRRPAQPQTTAAARGGPVDAGRTKRRLREFVWPQRYLPWQGRATRVDKFLMGAFLAVLVFGLAIRPLKPFLLASDPVLLELLTGDLFAIGAGAAFARIGEAPLWLVVVAGAIGMVKLDWLTWWAGRQWGAGILRMLTTEERAERFAARAAKWNPWIVRGAVLLAFLPGIPGAIVFAMAGLARMRLVTFLLLDLVGSVLVTALVAGLGYRLGQQAVDVVLLVDRYALAVSLTMITVTLLIPVIKRQIRRRRTPAQDHAGSTA